MPQQNLPIELIAWNIRSRFNIGSLFRIADACGIAKIHLCGITPTPPHPKIDKVALGAERTVMFEKYARILPLLKGLRKQKYQIVAIETGKASQPFYQYLPPRAPIALVVGSEVSGLPREVLACANAQLSIPMLGSKESLNVAIAFAVVAYHLRFSLR